MKHRVSIIAMSLMLSGSAYANSNQDLEKEIQLLQQQTKHLQSRLKHLQKKMIAQPSSRTSTANKKISIKAPSTKKTVNKVKTKTTIKTKIKEKGKIFHTSPLTVHTVDSDPESIGFYPTALIAEGRVISYIAGTPVVTSPYLGDRPAFDGSDYIVNISSINRDIRLMQQRRRLYRAYQSIGYPIPNIPIIAISGKVEPDASIGRTYVGKGTSDLTLGASELDVAAILNNKVEAYMSIAYDETPPAIGPRVSNSNFSLNQGFVNIGNLDQSPFYFTGGQLYVPFGRYSSSMISSSLPLRLARTKSRPFILGYKSQADYGPYAAIYGFKADTALGHTGIGGVNLGYTINKNNISGDIGVGFISSLTDSSGMQVTGVAPLTTFGGFSSPTNGNEFIHKVPGIDVHGNLSFDRYSLTAEWVGSSGAFRPQDLSFNGRGAKPQAAQLEAGVTFMAFTKPASLSAGYQWSKDSLALNLPQQRISGVFNISIWKDTIESIEYRHDRDYKANQFANGASAPGIINQNTIGTGQSSDSLIFQVGVFF